MLRRGIDPPPEMVPLSMVIKDVEIGREATIVVNSGSRGGPDMRTVMED